jgi:hypothetical protein
MFLLPLLAEVNAITFPSGEKDPILYTSPGALGQLVISTDLNEAGRKFSL